MTVSELLILVKDKTGRLDLSDTEFIRLFNEACLLLDSMENSDKRNFRYFLELEAGSYLVELPSEFRKAISVLMHSSEETTELVFYRFEKIKALLRLGADITLGYSIVDNGVALADLPDYICTLDPQDDPVLRNKNLVIFPKPTEACTIELNALCNSLLLDASVNTTNFWLTYYSDLVFSAVQYLLTREQLNPDHAGKVLQDLANRVSPLIHQLYAEEDIYQMEG